MIATRNKTIIPVPTLPISVERVNHVNDIAETRNLNRRKTPKHESPANATHNPIEGSIPSTKPTATKRSNDGLLMPEPKLEDLPERYQKQFTRIEEEVRHKREQIRACLLYHKGHSDWKSLPTLPPGNDDEFDFQSKGGFEAEESRKGDFRVAGCEDGEREENAGTESEAWGKWNGW